MIKNVIIQSFKNLNHKYLEVRGSNGCLKGY